MGKLNPLVDELQALVDRLEELTIKVNKQYEASQDPTRLKFISPMDHYCLEQVMCSNREERQAMFECRRIDLEGCIAEASRIYDRMLSGF